MSKRKNRRSKKTNQSGHHQGQGYSDVYRDGRAYVYTAWDDNAPEVGVEMSFDEWKSAYDGSSGQKPKRKNKKGRRK